MPAVRVGDPRPQAGRATIQGGARHRYLLPSSQVRWRRCDQTSLAPEARISPGRPDLPASRRSRVRIAGRIGLVASSPPRATAETPYPRAKQGRGASGLLSAESREAAHLPCFAGTRAAGRLRRTARPSTTPRCPRLAKGEPGPAPPKTCSRSPAGIRSRPHVARCVEAARPCSRVVLTTGSI